jgi:two-component system sensor histidine kinase TctE
MTQMVNKLLSLAKAEGESERFKPHEQVDLNELAQDVVHTVWEPLKRKSKTKVNCEPGTEPLIIEGSENSIRDLIENLVHNAIVYTPDGGEISVSAHNSGGVQLVVEDNGPGIPESERKKVFDRFYRIDSSVNTTGSGLGLAIVQEIADRHAATIELTEGSGGKGCRFTVKFKSPQNPVGKEIQADRRQYSA